MLRRSGYGRSSRTCSIFQNPRTRHPNEADINVVVQKTLTLVQNMIDVSNIETSIHLADGLPHVFVDEHQIQQVLVNLITNAVQAMTSGGRLVLSSRPGKKRKFRRDRRCGYGQGHCARVSSPYFRSLFQHQGGGGDRTRALGQLRHHQESSWRDQGGQQGRGRNDLYHRAAPVQ